MGLQLFADNATFTKELRRLGFDATGINARSLQTKSSALLLSSSRCALRKKALQL